MKPENLLQFSTLPFYVWAPTPLLLRPQPARKIKTLELRFPWWRSYMQPCFSWPWVFIHIFLAILWLSWFFGISPFGVYFVAILENNVILTIYKMRDKSFDVLTKNRTANMTSVDWAIDWSTNVGPKEEKGDPWLTKGQHHKKTINLQDSSLKHSFKLLSLVFDWQNP